MALLTALELSNNYPQNIQIDSYMQSDKYGSLCYRLKDGEIHKLLLSSHAIFKTSEEATQYMHEIGKEVKEKYL